MAPKNARTAGQNKNRCSCPSGRNGLDRAIPGGPLSWQFANAGCSSGQLYGDRGIPTAQQAIAGQPVAMSRRMPPHPISALPNRISARRLIVWRLEKLSAVGTMEKASTAYTR
jgi:hypothetical protein